MNKQYQITNNNSMAIKSIPTNNTGKQRVHRILCDLDHNILQHTGVSKKFFCYVPAAEVCRVISLIVLMY